MNDQGHSLSNVAGYCVGWESPRWSFRLRSQRVRTPMGGPRATLGEVTIATVIPSILSGVHIGFESTRHRAALRANKSPATAAGCRRMG